MNVENLSNSQLYVLIQNENLDASICKVANEEFERRKLTIEQIQEIVSQFDSQYKPADEEGLGLPNKIFLVVVPAFFSIQMLNAAKYLAKGQKRKWRDFWLFVCIGWLAWAVGFILYFRFARR